MAVPTAYGGCMPTGVPPEPDGPGAPGPTESDRALRQMLEDWQRHDPEGFRAFMLGDSTRLPDGDEWPAPATPYRQGSSMTVRRRGVKVLLAVVVALVVVAVSPIPGWVAALADPLLGTEGSSTAGEPVTRVPAPQAGGRLAPIVPVGAAPPASEYEFIRTQPTDGGPVTFDPCQAIHYVIRDHREVGTRGVEVVHEAVAEVSAATGLVFVFDGMTDEQPSESRAPSQPGRYGPSWAPLLVAWSDPDEVPELEGAVAGVGGPVSVRAANGRVTYVTGHVYLDTPDLENDLGVFGRQHLRAVVMHELGHVVGADHPEDESQLMAAKNTGQTEWQEGDRYALALLGQGECGS